MLVSEFITPSKELDAVKVVMRFCSASHNVLLITLAVSDRISGRSSAAVEVEVEVEVVEIVREALKARASRISALIAAIALGGNEVKGARKGRVRGGSDPSIHSGKPSCVENSSARAVVRTTTRRCRSWSNARAMRSAAERDSRSYKVGRTLRTTFTIGDVSKPRTLRVDMASITKSVTSSTSGTDDNSSNAAAKTTDNDTPTADQSAVISSHNSPLLLLILLLLLVMPLSTTMDFICEDLLSFFLAIPSPLP
mmetsp:Transcript_4482/g.8054  ORF Transcript_4482/g.8054 Transcript_4482/m.8054 type:complete len:253 (-) Transcript_4482:141-899(-)